MSESAITCAINLKLYLETFAFNPTKDTNNCQHCIYGIFCVEPEPCLQYCSVKRNSCEVSDADVTVAPHYRRGEATETNKPIKNRGGRRGSPQQSNHHDRPHSFLASRPVSALWVPRLPPTTVTARPRPTTARHHPCLPARPRLLRIAIARTHLAPACAPCKPESSPSLLFRFAPVSSTSRHVGFLLPSGLGWRIDRVSDLGVALEFRCWKVGRGFCDDFGELGVGV